MNKKLTIELSESIAAFCRANMNRKTNLPIRSSEMGCLIYVVQNAKDMGVLSVELSDYFGIKKSSVSAMVTSLEKMGYIKRVASQEDKRSSPIFPTDKGITLVNNTIEDYHRVSHHIIKELGDKECEVFLTTLNRITEIIGNGDV